MWEALPVFIFVPHLSTGPVPQSTDQKSSHQLALTPCCRVLTGRLQAWRRGFTKRLMNKQNTYMENMRGLHRLMVHPKEVSKWISLFFNLDTKAHMRKAHVHSSFLMQSLFSYLSGIYCSKKIKEEVNNNSTEKSQKACSCQVLSSHTYQGWMRTQSSAQNWNCGCWDFIVEIWATRTVELKFSTRNQVWAHTCTKR